MYTPPSAEVVIAYTEAIEDHDVPVLESIVEKYVDSVAAGGIFLAAQLSLASHLFRFAGRHMALGTHDGHGNLIPVTEAPPEAQHFIAVANAVDDQNWTEMRAAYVAGFEDVDKTDEALSNRIGLLLRQGAGVLLRALTTVPGSPASEGPAGC